MCAIVIDSVVILCSVAMPDNLMPIMVSSSLGVGVIAGVVSGICYVFIQGFRSTGTRRDKYASTNPWQCCICGAHFTPLPAAPTTPLAPHNTTGSADYSVRRFAVCTGCNGHACRSSCSNFVRGAWLCKQCEVHINTTRGKHDHHEEQEHEQQGWFRGILTALQPNAVTVRMSKNSGNASAAISRGNDASPSETVPQVSISGPDDDKEVVRDFIERLVGAMLGADLDDTSVARIYADAEYDAMFDRYHGDISVALTDLGSALHMSIANLPVIGQTPCTAHASLKNIIRRVLRDASNIAILKQPQKQNQLTESPETTTNRTYEDLLATAILNKVIDNYQGDFRRSSSGSASSRRSDSTGAHKRQKRSGDKEPRWRNVTGDDTTSMSSVEEWCRSESSAGEKFVDHMSFTIQQSIEEISTSDDERSSNHYLHSHNLSRNSLRNDKEKDENYLREDWQDNWLFSRKGKGSPKPVPVPMLVPNPSTDYRALIGDRDAEDTSDLSETGSDIDENDSVQDIKTILVDSRTVIGGKNLLEKVNTEYLETEVNDEDGGEEVVEETVVKSELTVEGSVTNGDTGFEDDDISEARNNTLIHESPYAESDSLGSNTEKDMEYTERYASIPRQISKDKGPVPSPRKSVEHATDQQNIELEAQAQNIGIEEREFSDESEEEINEEEPPISLRGSYSEKEKEKWRNPVALSNNPYSKENLDKRLQDKTSSLNGNYSFGRDYYIREAKRAAGGRKKFLDEDSNTEGSGETSDQQSLSPTTVHDDQNVFKAVPAVVHNNDEDVPEEHEDVAELHSITGSRPISLALSTDSEGVDVKRVYNIETGKVYTYKNNDFAKEIIAASKSPEGTKYVVNPNELISSNLADEVDHKFDENHNKTYENTQKELTQPIMNISNHIFTLIEKKSPEPKTGMLTKQQFLNQQISVEPEELEIELITYNESNKVNDKSELKESSKKYLQSLVRSNSKNNLKIEVVNSFTTPPISLQEYDTVDSVEKPKINKEEITASLIDLEDEFSGNTIEIETEDQNIKYKEIQSCIDLRFINEERPNYSVHAILSPASQNGFAKSTPNLNDEKLYYPEYEDRENEQKVDIVSELDELITIPKPSVRDLKKLFDQDKPAKVVVSRTKSNLTTKPELKAHRQVHSLTARSLSKEFRRDILPELQKADESKNDNSIEINGIVEENQEEIQLEFVEEVDELTVIPPCKSKIAFFELLKNK